jgi:hypothetical protein
MSHSSSDDRTPPQTPPRSVRGAICPSAPNPSRTRPQDPQTPPPKRPRVLTPLQQTAETPPRTPVGQGIQVQTPAAPQQPPNGGPIYMGLVQPLMLVFPQNVEPLEQIG